MGEVASDGQVLPQLGSVAMQSGQHVGRQIARRLHGAPTQPFEYWDKGFMATIGRGAAVVEFPNQQTLHGPLAYFAWMGVTLTLLSGVRNRIEVLWNWSWSALTHDRAARIIIQPTNDDVKTAGNSTEVERRRQAAAAEAVGQPTEQEDARNDVGTGSHGNQIWTAPADRRLTGSLERE